MLQANFQLDSNPDGQDLERIAGITGLSKRVTQVWFQNSRARHKKHHSNKIKACKLKIFVFNNSIKKYLVRGIRLAEALFGTSNNSKNILLRIISKVKRNTFFF